MDIATIVTIIVLIAILALILAGFLVFRRGRERRTEERRERTREEFGAEYERIASERGSEEEAERELRERRHRMERRVEPLSSESRDGYAERWEETERIFVENPEASLEMADRTVTDLLHERNIVAEATQSSEETEKSLGALYPEVADDYREARRLRARVVGSSAEGGGAEDRATEEMRQALRRYRTVYERLVQD